MENIQKSVCEFNRKSMVKSDFDHWGKKPTFRIKIQKSVDAPECLRTATLERPKKKSDVISDMAVTNSVVE